MSFIGAGHTFANDYITSESPVRSRFRDKFNTFHYQTLNPFTLPRPLMTR